MYRVLPPWFDDSACAGYPLEFWFPKQGQSNKEALKLCNACPVKEECLDWALDLEKSNTPHGIFGGLTPKQRSKLKRCMIIGCKEKAEFTPSFCTEEHQELSKRESFIKYNAKKHNTGNDGVYHLQGSVRGVIYA